MNINSNILNFLSSRLGSIKGVTRLAGDASTRTYYRVRTGGMSYILCEDKSLVETGLDNHPFKIIYDLIKNRVPVPAILSSDAAAGLILQDDLGDGLLESIVAKYGTSGLSGIYRRAIDNLIEIQKISGADSIPFTICFDVKKLMFEFDFFIEHALKTYFGADKCDHTLAELRGEFDKISTLLYKPEMFVLNHRDYHSRNLIIRMGIPFIIDFQDARMGLPQYDAVSLLRDSYVVLDNEIFRSLKNYYFNAAVEGGIIKTGKDEFEYYFDIMAFQRNVKALGTFGYQVSVKGNPLYEKYIGQTLDYLADYADRHDELKKASKIITECIN